MDEGALSCCFEFYGSSQQSGYVDEKLFVLAETGWLTELN